MKRALILTALAATLAGGTGIALAQADGATPKPAECGPTTGKPCADGKGMQGSRGMQGRMEHKHGEKGMGDMAKNHERMGEMHAKMHGAAGAEKEQEHKH